MEMVMTINPKNILYAGLPVAASLLLGGCLMPTSEKTDTASASEKTVLAASVSTTWTSKPGSAWSIGAGAASDVAMMEKSTDVVKYWNGSTWVATSTGLAFEVDEGPLINGNPSIWVIGQDSKVYESDDHGSNWNFRGSQWVSDIGVSTGGAAWALGATTLPGSNDFPLYKWNSSTSTWDLKSGGGVRVDAAPDGSVWLVNSAHEIWHCNSSGTSCNKPYSQAATDIGVGSNGKLWIIGNTVVANGDFNILEWDAATSTWQETNGGARRITVDSNGDPWICNNAGAIYKGHI
jgi:hypothetical protein